MRRQRRGWEGTIVGAILGGLLVGLFVLIRIADFQTLQEFRELTFDIYQRVSPRTGSSDVVRIIDIDDASLNALGQWPWPRTRVAELVNRLDSLGAAVIVFDVIFAEPDRTSPARFAQEVEYEDILDSRRMRALFNQLPDHDQILARSIAASSVVTGWGVHPTNVSRPPELKPGMAFGGTDPVKILPAFAGATVTIPPLESAAAGNGSVSLSAADTGGVLRRVPLLFSDGKRVLPSLLVEALRVAQGAGTIIVRANDASGDISGGAPALTQVRVGAFDVPVTAKGEIWVRYARDRRESYVSVLDVFAGDTAPERLRPLIEGNIVYIGTSAVGLLDIRTSPLGELIPGVSVHAQATAQIIDGDYIYRPDWSNGLEIVAVAVLGMLIIMVLPVVGAYWAGGIGALSSAIIAGVSWYAFSEHGILLDMVYPLAATFFVFAGMTLYLFVSTESERRFVRGAFGQYLSPALVQRIETDASALELGGEIRDVTILFSDIRGFTPLSEQLSPTNLVSFLNNLLTPLSDEILNRQGTIDKYIGDAIMAFWNAPVTITDHPRKACRAALAMQQSLASLNAADAFGFKALGLTNPEVAVGIGLNLGDACVGNMGSGRRFDYSVIGDAVNVAARIESSCKEIGYGIVTSQTVVDAVPGFAFLAAGEVSLKGKAEALRLHILVGDETYAASEEFSQLAEAHARLAKAAESGTPAEFDTALAACAVLAPSSLTLFYRQLATRLFKSVEPA